MKEIKNSQAIIFAYDLNDVDSVKAAFKNYNLAKTTILEGNIPHFLVGVTMDNVSENTIQEMRTLKVFQLADQMA